MLHLYYQDFLGVRLSSCPKRKNAISDSQERMAAQERLAAQRDSSPVDQLSDAFAHSESCQHCRLVGEVRDFAEWRAKSLKELAMHRSVINCWVNVVAAPFDWKSVRYDPCICPFAFGYWGLHWQPASVEATCLLLAQSFAVGTDVHIRLSNSATLIPCHSFLLHDFIRLYKRGAWPLDSESQLLKEGGKVVLQLNYRYYSLEIIQFVFYSAYGYVLNFSNDDLTSQTFTLIRSAVQHFTGEPNSICRHLVDIPGLLTNLIVLLDRLVRRVTISDVKLCRLVPDMAALFRMNRLFDDLQKNLFAKLYSEVKNCLEVTGADMSVKLGRLHRPDHCPNSGCIYLDLSVNLFKKMVLVNSQPAEDCAATLEASLQMYLSDLVDLYEINRSEAMIKACRDLRCISGILCIIGRPCSESFCSFQSLLVHVCHTLLLLACDQIVLNFSEVLWIHNAKFLRRVAFQSQLCLVKHHKMPDNTFWNPVSFASRDRGLELVIMHFRFTISFAQTIIHLAARLKSLNSTESAELDSDWMQQVHPELSNPAMLDVFAFPELMRNFEQLQLAVSKVSARDMRSIAYASYSTVRMPRMRLVVQTVALLHSALLQQAEKLLASEVNQASEGRQILCTEELLKGLVSELSPVQFYIRLQHDAGLWDRLEAYDKSSNCCFGTARRQHQLTCPDHGSYHHACLVWAWFRSLVAAVAVLRRSSRVFASPDAFRGCIERFIAANADFFTAHAADLLDSGEMDRSHHELLLDLLARVQQKRVPWGLSRLPQQPGIVADRPAGAGAAVAPVTALKTGIFFEMKLLPSLCFHFVPHSGQTEGFIH